MKIQEYFEIVDWFIGFWMDRVIKQEFPIKASDFYMKPTLRFLEEKFVSNETSRQPHKARVKNEIDLAFLRQPNHSLGDLIKALDRQSINTVLRQNEQGIIYGILMTIKLNASLMATYWANNIVQKGEWRCGVISRTTHTKTISDPACFFAAPDMDFFSCVKKLFQVSFKLILINIRFVSTVTSSLRIVFLYSRNSYSIFRA